MKNVLILYYSRDGNIAKMSQYIAEGVESVEGTQSIIRTVPDVSPLTEQTEDSIPEQGAPYCSHNDLIDCSGLIMGSPTYFGNMAAPLKYFLDQTSNLWFGSDLSGKPAGVFTSAGSTHGGHESTLLSMMLPLLHHGMLITGLSYHDPVLIQTNSGGSPYGASHEAGDGKKAISEDEKHLCRALGKRVAEAAKRLNAQENKF